MVHIFEEGIPLLLSEKIEVREMITDMMFIPETISQPGSQDTQAPG